MTSISRSGGERLIWWMLILAYIALLTWDLSSFPIYFFCDEAIHGVEASSILTKGADSYGEAWPLYFRGFGDFQLGFSVYAHIPSVALLGLSEFSVRLTGVIFSVLAILAVKELLRIFELGSVWATPLVFIGAPFWFVHSRSGFEVIIAASFYLWYWATYAKLVKSKQQSPFYALLPAILAGLCFYSYTPARGWILLSVLSGLAINLISHLRNPRSLLLFIIALAVVFTPYGIFHARHPGYALRRLNSLGVQSIGDIAKPEMIERAVKNLATVIDPRFWFYTDQENKNEYPERHIIPGYADIPLIFAPLSLLGVIGLLWRTKLSVFASFAAFGVAGVFPAILVGVNPLRSMPVGIMYLVFTVVGIDTLIRFPLGALFRKTAATLVFVCLLGWNYQLNAFVHGDAKISYRDYQFYGVQYGALQLYEWIESNMEKFEIFKLSHALFNGNDIFPRFYFPGQIDSQRKIQIVDVEGLCKDEKRVSAPGEAVIVPVSWYREREAILRCLNDTNLTVVVAAPTGQPLFGLVH